ncbi:hypothetical protein AZE42_02823 [Rhizopogon vesiculosus]|uniref:Uncharacterized protein n=1 Tax=Rhizopogon vesiculosus TaxID=180088 RepID=A0A1J8QG93_9AGAM|nr:hypothetical protein AZE42_02823 [Rhizopogon vesiculosus]
MLFTYATNQAITTFSLAAVSAWFASERWIFVQRRGRGHVWLEDAINEATVDLIRPLMLKMRKIIRYCNRQILAFNGLLRRVSFKKVSSVVTRIRRKTHPTLPTTQEGPAMINLSPQFPMSVRSVFTEQSNSVEGHASDGNESSRRAIARGRFKAAVRSVIMMQQAQLGLRVQSILRPMILPLTPSFDRNSTNGMSSIRFSSIGLSAIRRPRPPNLIPELRTLEPRHELLVHTALVQHLQFSPNGKYLATSSWDRSSIVFRVGEALTTQAVLVHVRGFIGQVAWSASSTLLLTRLTRGMKIWTAEDGICKKTIDRPHSVSSVAWLPGSESQFFSVEGSDVFKLDTRGRVLDSYHFGRIQLRNVAVTPDGQRLLGVGPLLAAPNGLHLRCSGGVEKRIIVFNIETRIFENQIPVVNDVRNITISKRGGNVLISFEHKTPAQLWKMELVRGTRDREHPFAQIATLTLRHTYLPKAQIDFVGPSYFGGKDDQFVLCAGKAGDIHIWERDTAALLHYVRPQPFGRDLTCIAWNHSTDDPFMLATGSHDGTVRIWTTQPGDCMSDAISHLEQSVSDWQYASSSILRPAPSPGPSRTLRVGPPTIRTTSSER